MRVKQIAFGLTLLGAGLGPLAPAFEAAPILRLVIQMFFILAGVLWVMSMSLEGRVRLRRTGLGVFLLLLAGALLCATVNACYKYPAVLTLFSWVSGIVAFLFVAYETPSRRRRFLLLLVLGASSFVVALHGLHQITVELPRAREMFVTNPSGVLRELGLSPDALFDFEGRLGKNRIFSTFLLPNSLAGFLVLVLPALAGLLLDGWKAQPPERRVVSAIGRGMLVAPMLLALYFTKSKGGWMALALAGVVFVSWAFGSALWRKRQQVLCGALCLLVVWLIAQASGILPPLRDYPGSYSVRYGYWRAGSAIFAAHPFVGVGLDNFADHYAATKRPEDQEARRAHNDYIEIAAEGGVIVISAYALFWAFFWRRIRRREDEPVLPLSETSVLGRAEVSGLAALSACIFALELLCDGTLRSGPGFWGWQWAMALWLGWMLFFFASAAGQGEFALGRTSYAAVGIGCGIIAFLIHSFVDFDHYVGGTLQTAWIMMGLLLSTRMSEERETYAVDRVLHPGLRLAAALGAIAIALFLIYGFMLRVAESHVLREQALAPDERVSQEQRRLHAEQAIESNPLDAQNHALLSDLYLHLWLAGRRTTGHGGSTLSEAIKSAKNAIELDPARSEYYTRLGRLYEIRWFEKRAAGDQVGAMMAYQDAAEAYWNAEELFPSNPDTALNRARLYDLVGRYDVALGKYRAAERLSEEQYHIPRKFSPAELAELRARIDILKVCNTTYRAPPPPEFGQPRLLGWPRGMFAESAESKNKPGSP